MRPTPPFLTAGRIAAPMAKPKRSAADLDAELAALEAELAALEGKKKAPKPAPQEAAPIPARAPEPKTMPLPLPEPGPVAEEKPKKRFGLKLPARKAKEESYALLAELRSLVAAGDGAGG